MGTIKRTAYLNQLLKWRDKHVIKIITGIRRCGKSTLMMQFQQQLRDKRVSEKQIISVNLEDLAFEINMDWSFLARIETGKTVASVETLFKITKALGIKLEQLFAGADATEDEVIKKEFNDVINVVPKKEKDKIISIIKLILEK